MGIGGLDNEFSAIFRRAFASRVFPPDVVEAIGMQHSSYFLSVRNGRKEGNVSFNDALNILFTVIWRQTYGYGPF